MLILSDLSVGLVKYHVNAQLNKDTILKVFYTSSLQEVENSLLEGISYNEEGELCKVIWIIIYTGLKILDINFKQNKNNITYLLVSDIKHFKVLSKNKNVKILNITALQYKHEIEDIQKVLSKEAFDYFWSEYCIDKFNSNPIKWHLECRHLLFVYQEKNRDLKELLLLTIEDLDLLYNKVTDNGNLYLRHMFTKRSQQYLLKLKKEELFLLFIKGPNLKSPVLKSIELHSKNNLFTYACFKESFYKGYLRLNESIFILDYIMNSKELIDYTTIRKLFKLV